MLIEFSVSNFRSFRDKQTFSMVAAPRLGKKNNTFKPKVEGEKLPDLLKVAAIYGANASGKSNLIMALDTVRKIATRAPSAEFEPLPVAPFRFDPVLVDQPSCFELHFIQAGQRYEFALQMTRQRIIGECLVAFPSGKETLLYARQHTPSGDVYQFGTQLEGEKELHEVWKKLTGPQTLFLVQAVANSSEGYRQLRMPWNWLRVGVMSILGGMGAWTASSQELAKKHSDFAREISSFLQNIDVPISNIRFETLDDAGVMGLPGIKTETKMVLTHQTSLGEADFDLHEESEGTKNLIGFWMPWKSLQPPFDKILHRALVIDELDSSLHPKIVAALVEEHLKSESSAQLIFTTHDTHLMDTKLLRRDQIWLTERDANGATQLRSIHDFAGREGEDLEKRYYQGRYRGLPLVRKG